MLIWWTRELNKQLALRFLAVAPRAFGASGMFAARVSSKGMLILIITSVWDTDFWLHCRYPSVCRPKPFVSRIKLHSSDWLGEHHGRAGIIEIKLYAILFFWVTKLSSILWFALRNQSSLLATISTTTGKHVSLRIINFDSVYSLL